MTPEGLVKKKIKDWLDEIGVWHFSPMSFGYGRRGIPDIVGAFRDRPVAIECKREGGARTKWQERECLLAHRAGAVVIIAENLEQVKRKFREEFGAL